MRTVNLTLRIINGFTLDEFLNTIELQDDRYNFTCIEGQEVPTQDEITGDKQAIVDMLRHLLKRLENPTRKEVKLENWYDDPEKGRIKLPY